MSTPFPAPGYSLYTTMILEIPVLFEACYTFDSEGNVPTAEVWRTMVNGGLIDVEELFTEHVIGMLEAHVIESKEAV